MSVATGMALASIGTDTGGSARIPAAACGLVGLKPTSGEIPVDGILASALRSGASVALPRMRPGGGLEIVPIPAASATARRPAIAKGTTSATGLVG